MKRGRPDFSKPKDFKSALKNLLFFLKPYLSLIIISVTLATFASIFSIIGPDKIKEITNIIVVGLKFGIDISKIKTISLFLLTIYLNHKHFECTIKFIDIYLFKNTIFINKL